MREDPADRQLGYAQETFEGAGQLVRLEAQPVEIGINLDVHRRTRLLPARRFGELRGKGAAIPKRNFELGGHRIVEIGRWNRPEDEECLVMPAARSASASSSV